MSFGDLTRINTNLQALRANNSLQMTNQRLGAAQLRLATGSRINQAADDSAGFALASKLEARVRGQSQAQANIGDAQSMLTVAEGGANTIMDIVQSLKEKAVQANNDSLGTEEVQLIQNQIEALRGEIDAIAEGTDFNGVDLLDGSIDGLTFQVDADSGDTFTTTALDDDFDSVALAIDGIDVTMDSEAALTAIDNAIDTLATRLGGIGDAQNSLEFRLQNLTTATDNNEAARSRIMDADFAKEQMEVVKQQILQQTGTAALAQANAAPQSVLSLLQ